jgi:hypothetical protein
MISPFDFRAFVFQTANGIARPRGDQVGLIGIKRLAHGDRSTYIVLVIGILAAARQLARPFPTKFDLVINLTTAKKLGIRCL